MKLANLKFYVVDASWRNWVFVKVFTDEGVTGVGEASLEGHEESVVASLRAIKSYLVGKNPLEIEHHFRALNQGSFWKGPAYLSAIGGIEQALWDILGKVCNQPVHALVGTIQPDVIHVGGILELKKIAALAEARYVRVAPHNPNGPIATVATSES